MSNQESNNQPFFQRYAWIILLVLAGIFTLFGVVDVIRGMDADPAIAESILGTDWEVLKETRPDIAYMIDLMAKSLGATIAVLSILSIAVILRPFKLGEPWAWYVLWIWPLWYVCIFLLFFYADRSPEFSAPPPMLSAPVFFAITVLALVASYRKFFPRS